MMKKYIGTKGVEAEPMTLGEFYNRKKVNPFGVDIEQHEETEMGYLVKYEDGVENWFVKEAFEKAYKPADTFKDRLVIEQQELAGRLDKLCSFVDSPKFEEVVTDKEQRDLLLLQRKCMGEYMYVLGKRIANL